MARSNITNWEKLLSPKVPSGKPRKPSGESKETQPKIQKPSLHQLPEIPSLKKLDTKTEVDSDTRKREKMKEILSSLKFKHPVRPEYCFRGKQVNPKLMVVTDNVSYWELKYRLAFCGDAGALLQRTLYDAGLDVGNYIEFHEQLKGWVGGGKEVSDELFESIQQALTEGDVFYLHLNCNPRYNFGEVAPMTDQDYFDSLIEFHKTVCKCKPSHILLLGAGSVAKVLGRPNVASHAGVTFDYKFPVFLQQCVDAGNNDSALLEAAGMVYDCKVDVDMHPAYILKSELHSAVWKLRLGNLVGRLGEDVVQKPVQCTTFTDFQEAKDFLISWINDPTLKTLSYDWETISLCACAYLDKSITLVINVARDADHGYVIPTFHKDVDWSLDQRIEITGLIGKLLLKPRDYSVGHNLLFDNLVSRRDPYTGIGNQRIPGFRIDTMVVSYLLDENSTHGLKDLCNIHTDLKNYDWELEEYKKTNRVSNYGDIPLGVLSKYGAYDAVAPLRLYESLKKLLLRDKRADFNKLYKMMSIQSQALEDLPFWGQKIDKNFLMEMSGRFEIEVEDSIQKLLDTDEMRGFIEQRIVERSVEVAKQGLTKPVNCTKTYMNLNPMATRSDVVAIFKKLKEGLDHGSLLLDDVGKVTYANGVVFEDSNIVEQVFFKMAQDQYNVDMGLNSSCVGGERKKYTPNFNTNGGGEMGDFFYKYLNIPIEFTTDKGAPSLDKKALDRLSEINPVAKHFKKYKGLVKEKGTYIDPLVKAFQSFDNGENPDYGMSMDGIAHFNVYNTNTRTGRTCVAYDTIVKLEGEGKLPIHILCQMDDKFETLSERIPYVPRIYGKQWSRTRPKGGKANVWDGFNYKKVISGIYAGVKETFKLVLENGLSLRGTPDHRVLTDKGWCELRHLNSLYRVLCDDKTFSVVKSVAPTGYSEKVFDLCVGIAYRKSEFLNNHEDKDIESILQNPEYNEEVDTPFEEIIKFAYSTNGIISHNSADLIQLIPRKSDAKKYFKSRFDKGTIVQFDLSQIELRVLAAVSKDEGMIDTYKSGGDLHQATVELLFGDRYHQADKVEKKEMRSAAKKVNFGLSYGTGSTGLAKQIKDDGVELLNLGQYDVEEVYRLAAVQLKLDRNDWRNKIAIETEVDKVRAVVAKSIINSFFEGHPQVKSWIEGVHRFVEEHGYISSPIGRIRRLPNAMQSVNNELQSDALRQAQNFPIQSAASDLAVMSLVAVEFEIYERGLRACPCLAVHDMIGVDCPLSEANEVCEIMRRWMNNPAEAFEKYLPGLFDMSWLCVPIETDGEVGPSWGQSYAYKDGKLKVADVEDGSPETIWIDTDSLYEYLECQKTNS